MKKLYEIRASVEYAVVIAANSPEEAIEHIKTWEHSWDSSSDLLGVDYELVETREPLSQDLKRLEDEAHVII